ncbi:MAG: amidase [Candidatus Tectomicrobia bacterium]|uniref:Amidase n=1 Tax=Tectimicrobiota bacterium TaxID=2528274 RepID=A0A933GNI2_UNCTE|nr:amidase [Candidatus Tectomicrobia bacterium]
MRDDLTGYDAIGLGELIRKGEIKPSELIETTIKSIEKINPRLNAVIYKMYELARQQAAALESKSSGSNKFESLLSGVPFLLKDLLAEYKGTPFHEGSLAVKGYISKIDTELVKRQKSAGLITVGKTNTPEFGLMPCTDPAIYGPTCNPWNPALTAGGSSGGSAAAVAAGVVTMAHGNDMGGSIRIPASCCGLFGLKPTRGRNPLGPLFGDICSGLVHEHAITRTVRDSAALLDATSGPELGDPYCAPPKERPLIEEIGRQPGPLKMALLTGIPDGWHDDKQLHPDCKKAAEEAALLCESLGHTVEAISPQDLSHSSLQRSFNLMATGYTGHVFAYWEAELGKKITQDQVEPVTWATYQAGLRRTAGDYLRAVEDIQRFARKMAHCLNERGYSVILSPTLALPPQKHEAFKPTPDDPRAGIKMIRTFGTFTFPFNTTGQPAMSVPLFWNKENVPIGVQFASRFGDEATLFRLASQLEQARPWAERKPPIHCGHP